jgi:hypothetical protein
VCYLECDFFTQVAFNFEILAAYFAQENVLWGVNFPFPVRWLAALKYTFFVPFFINPEQILEEQDKFSWFY